MGAAVNRDPNRTWLRPSLDGQGDLKVVRLSTLIGFVNRRACAYQFAFINRGGMRTSQGRPAEKE